MLQEWIFQVLAGLGVGLAVGVTGVGGGALMTPILIQVFKVPAPIAVGTDLLYAAFTKAAGVWAHHKKRNVEWSIVILLLSGSVPSALVTVSLIGHLKPDTETLESVIVNTMAVALVLTAITLMLRTRIQAMISSPKMDRIKQRYIGVRPVLTVAAGCMIGVLVSITSVGAGVIGTTIVLLMYPRMRTVSIIGTEVAHAVPLTLVAGLGHWQLNAVDFGLLTALLVGSLPGAYIGGKLGSRVSDKLLRPILSGMLLLIAATMVFK